MAQWASVPDEQVGGPKSEKMGRTVHMSVTLVLWACGQTTAGSFWLPV